MYQELDYSTAGNFTQKRKKPMVGGTIEEATLSLVKMMWDNFGRCPFYQRESTSKIEFSTGIQDLIKAMVSVSPSSKSQQTITPALLKYMAQHTVSILENNVEDYTADLIIGAFFFAVHSCEYRIPK